MKTLKLFHSSYPGFYFLLLALLFIWLLCRILVKHRQLKRSQEIPIGMPESEMLRIMGKGYTRSLLRDGRIAYEWQLGSLSFGSRGIRSHTGVRKATIVCKDGAVEEVRGTNIG